MADIQAAVDRVNEFGANLGDLTRAGLANDTVLTQLRTHLIDLSERLNGADRDGASLLDIQRGIFNLLQASAYRMHKQVYALDYHTHQDDKTLPYLLSNFTAYLREVVEIYKELQVVDEKYFPIIDDLGTTVEREVEALRERIANWNDEKQQAWIEHEKALTENKNRVQPSVNPQTPVTSKTQPEWLKLDNSAPGPQDAAFAEGFGEYNHEGDSSLFLQRQQPVFLDADVTIPGCNVEESFWYKQFLPKLLAACSVDVQGYADDETVESLDEWFQWKKDNGFFNLYGHDVRDAWPTVGRKTKLSIKRAWRLCEHYFFGPQKQRERSGESGVDHRESGDLTQYVAFLDVFLGKSYVEQAGMRLTFPYFIGPSTWTFHHAIAERAAGWHESNPSASIALVNRFKSYLAQFITIYPCPYCRNHLNRYVIIGRERDLYPVEYLFVGWTPTAENLDGTITVQDKLSYIKNGLDLRLFVWKLHNAVNSSIARQEKWYQKEESCINTSRYWPNIDAELYRASLRSGVISAPRLREVMDIIEIAVKLDALRSTILNLDASHIESVMSVVQPLLDKLDFEIVDSGYLQETYAFAPGLIDAPPDINWAAKWGDLVRHEDFTLS